MFRRFPGLFGVLLSSSLACGPATSRETRTSIAQPSDDPTPGRAQCQTPTELFRSLVVLDRVPPYSTDAQIFGVHDGERITFQGRFEEVEGGGVREISGVVWEPSPWRESFPANNAAPQLVEDLRSLYSARGLQVDSVQVLCEGRRIAGREVVALPGSVYDVREFLVNGNRSLTAAEEAHCNYTLSTMHNLSRDALDLASAQGRFWFDAPRSGVFAAPSGRDHQAPRYAAFRAQVLAATRKLARGDLFTDPLTVTDPLPAGFAQHHKLRVSVALLVGGRRRNQDAWLVVDTNELLTSGATKASTRVDIDGQWIDAHFTARTAQVAFDSCGDHPFHVKAELNVVTARGTNRRAALRFEGTAFFDGSQVALGHLLVPEDDVQQDSNGNRRSVIWDSLDGYGDGASRVRVGDRLALVQDPLDHTPSSGD